MKKSRLKIVFSFLLVLAIAKSSRLYAQVSNSGCYISGVLADPTSTLGCGNSGTNNYCNLASLYVPAFSPSACPTATSSGGVSHTKATVYTLPAGCTATIEAEYRKRNYLGVGATATGCSNSGMDGSPDALYITQSGGVVASQGSTIDVNVGTCGPYPALGVYTGVTSSISPGCSNADGYVKMIVTGGTFTVGGVSNRADEVITFTVNMSGNCGPLCSSVLPIELLAFYGIPANDKVILQWKVATELNVNYYLVEKSIDAEQWSEVIKIPSKSEAFGVNQFYETQDNYPQKGINYYRLTNYDKDGSHGESRLITVNYERDAMPVWVEQTTDELIIHLNGKNLSGEIIELYDISGRVVFSSALPQADDKISIKKQSLAKGIYTLRAESDQNQIFNKLLIH